MGKENSNQQKGILKSLPFFPTYILLGLSKKCNHQIIRQIKFRRVIAFENFNPFMGWL